MHLMALNAPYGARCFLTCYFKTGGRMGIFVLMHLMVLGAF